MSQGSVGAERLEEFRVGVLGPVLAPEDSGYDEVRPVWNGMYDQRRAAVTVRPMGVADVQAAIAFARANDLTIGFAAEGTACPAPARSTAGCCST